MMTGVGDGGVPHGELLMQFAEAVLAGERRGIDRARAALLSAVGPDGVVDAAGVVGLFNAIDRVADATGTALEDKKSEVSAGMREDIGIDAFARRKSELDSS